MSLENKVVWSEGMFINPQHFQQQERYFESFVQRSCRPHGQFSWGLSLLEIDQQLLKLGKISVTRAQGVFPDGTPFSFPDVDDCPNVLDIPIGVHSTTIYLAIPVKRLGSLDVQKIENTQVLARFYAQEISTRDTSRESSDDHVIEVAKLRFKLLLETDDLSGYVCIAIARIYESKDDKSIILDEQHIPTVLSLSASPKLSNFMQELVGLLHHRAEAIAGRLGDSRRGGTAEIADYLLLQVINRVEPFFRHLSHVKNIHPELLFSELLKLVGELATFLSVKKRVPDLPGYLHDDLQQTYLPLIATLREQLTMVYEQTAIALKLEEKKYGIRVSEIVDRSLINTAIFVLVVRADVPDEFLRIRLPAQIKIGPVERIRELVNAAIPGIGLKALPVAPRQIPYRSGFCYFELDKHNQLWRDLQTSGGFAMHLGADFPGIELEFWAIRV